MTVDRKIRIHFLNLRFAFFKCESGINKISTDVWLVMIGQYLAEIQLLKIWKLRMQKNQNIEKIVFKIVQMKFLAMHITNQKLNFDIFTVENVQNIFMEHDRYLISQ